MIILHRLRTYVGPKQVNVIGFGVIPDTLCTLESACGSSKWQPTATKVTAAKHAIENKNRLPHIEYILYIDFPNSVSSSSSSEVYTIQ